MFTYMCNIKLNIILLINTNTIELLFRGFLIYIIMLTLKIDKSLKTIYNIHDI